MAVKRRAFSRDFKLQVVREVETGKSQAQIAREHRISQNLISRWCRAHRRYKDRAFAGKGHAYTDDARVAALERMVGKLTMENDLLKKSLTEARGRNVVKQRDWKYAPKGLQFLVLDLRRKAAPDRAFSSLNQREGA